ncbi:MAG TPA: mechanosensitive ion channel [Candidatus Sumerlaeota bacterium]|nr:mechanosensitive ion channel [Candidatus Sumerlaeota bacterium]
MLIEFVFWMALAILVGSFAIYLLFGLLNRLTPRLHRPLLRLIIQHLRAPLRLLGPLLAAKVVADSYPDLTIVAAVNHVIALLLIGAIAWLLIAAVRILRERIMARYDITSPDNLAARKIATQLRVLQRILVILIVFIAAACALMTFDQVKAIGASLLASAGIAGIILGFAAQKSLATFMAGLQIAISQPIRIDDVVIVEGEWGRIEEITLTYVVVRIWDQRRLIVPITYFIEQPFQNWTRVSAELMGTVFLYLDYTVPLDKLRAEQTRLLEQDPNWDGRVNVVQVTDAREHTMEVRLLVSAANSGNLWSLRVALREGMLDYIRREFPDSLPRVRAELRQPDLQGPRPVEA